MSETTPVCSKCHYRLGGWSSSTCPECGEDVCKVGVRVGAKTSSILVGLVFSIITISCLTKPVLLTVRWLCSTQTQSSAGVYRSLVTPYLTVAIDSDSVWRRFPSLFSHKTTILLAYSNFHPRDIDWYEGNSSRNRIVRQQTVTLTEVSDSMDHAIENAVTVVLEPDASEEVIRVHTQSIEKLVEMIIDSLSHGKYSEELKLSWSDGVLNTFGTRGGRVGLRSLSWHGTPLILAVFLFCIWVCMRIAKRICKPSWRLPREGEWSSLKH